MVLGRGWEGEGGVEGMWYATAEGPGRRMGWVLGGRGDRTWGRGDGEGRVRLVWWVRAMVDGVGGDVVVVTL